MSKDGTIHEWHLASNSLVRAAVQEYRGKRVLDIRKHYEAADGLFMPTKRGICLGLTVENIRELELAISKAKGMLDKQNGAKVSTTKGVE